MLNIVKRPFKSGGVFYPVGSIIKDPTGIKLYKAKVNEGKIIQVDEQDIDNVVKHFKAKMGVDIQVEATPETPSYDAEYLARVEAAAKKYDVDMEGKSIEEVIAKVREKQEEVKKANE